MRTKLTAVVEIPLIEGEFHLDTMLRLERAIMAMREHLVAEIRELSA